jgi:Tol biopolymer transport system component
MKKYLLPLFATLIINGCTENSIQPEVNSQYKIAFAYTDSTGGKLAIVNRDGSNLKVVHNLTASASLIRWSPDCSKIVFDLYFTVNIGVVNSDGSGFKIFSNVSSGNYEGYSWFEDSRRVAFSRNDSVYSIDVITDIEKFIAMGDYPEVSPAGDKIAILKNLNLYIVNEDGTNEFHLVDSASQGFKWSPDGNKIAFAGTNGALYLINNDGSDKIQLIPEGNVNSHFGSSISWSPDGQQLSYSQIYGVGVVNSDGTENKIIALNAYSPDWCGDGSFIICNSVESGLLMLKPDGTDSIQVVSNKPDFNVAWSPKPLP